MPQTVPRARDSRPPLGIRRVRGVARGAAWHPGSRRHTASSRRPRLTCGTCRRADASEGAAVRDPPAAARCGPGPGPSPPPPRTPWAWRGGGRSPPATPGQRRRPRRHRADAELGACRCREHRRPPVRLCVSQIAHLQTEALESRRSAGLRGGHLVTWPRAARSQSRSRAGAADPAGARRAIHHAKPSQPGVERRLRGLWSGAEPLRQGGGPVGRVPDGSPGRSPNSRGRPRSPSVSSTLC